MKKYLLLLGFIFAVFSFYSCGDDEEIERLKAQNDSLQNVANEKNAQVEEFMQAFNEIQKNLNTIKEKEQIIELNASADGEMSPNMVEQINNDILLIYELMLENKEALAKLKNKISASAVKNKELTDMLALYEQQMLQKDEEISMLKQKLEEMNFNMQELNKKISDLEMNVDTLQQLTENQNKQLNEQDKLLHTAYYVIGTKEELKTNNVLTKDGILSKLTIDADFNKTYFTEVDYRNLNEIPINHKKIEIMTQHPSNSYTIIESEGTVTKIKINDKDKFWSLSKFLVVMLK